MQMEVTGKARKQVCLLAESIYSGIIKGYVCSGCIKRGYSAFRLGGFLISLTGGYPHTS